VVDVLGWQEVSKSPAPTRIMNAFMTENTNFPPCQNAAIGS